jgi:hypothetical protein
MIFVLRTPTKKQAAAADAIQIRVGGVTVVGSTCNGFGFGGFGGWAG